MPTSYYSTGTVTVSNGSTTVTGTGTAWQIALITGGNIFVQAPGNPMPIDEVVSDTEITSELEWTGTTGTYGYRIQRDTAYLKTLDANSENLAYLLSEMRQGTLFKYDQAGTFAGRDIFDDRTKGFAYLVTDGEAAELYVKLSAASGDWAGPFAYGTGPVGPQGDSGPYTEIIAGTVTTLTAGSSATVSARTVDADTVALDFGIPKGVDGAGTGDVVGPASTADGAIAAFDTTTGKLIKSLTDAQVRTIAGSNILGGFRNKIINPLGAVNQRTVSGTVTLAAGAYGHDRFKAGASGCTYTFATTNGVTTFSISAGSLQQVIEASAFSGEAGEYYLGWAGTAQGRINGGAYGASGAVSATCDGSANVTVEWNAGTLSLPQFERGYLGDFTARHLHDETMLCMRYFEVLTATIFALVSSESVGQKYSTWSFKVRKRASPTMSNMGTAYAGISQNVDFCRLNSAAIDQPSFPAGAIANAEL
jgi:hypothetical protein